MITKVSEAQRPCARGYKPLVLTLTGFKGTESGLGRETVSLDLEALAGYTTLMAPSEANGRGETKRLQNLQP